MKDLVLAANKPFTAISNKLQPKIKRLAEVGSDVAVKTYNKVPEVLFGEDTGLSPLDDILVSLVPTGSFAAKKANDAKPGLLDYVDFVPGVGGAVQGGLKALRHLPELSTAMLPIAKLGTDALSKVNRIGKNERNLEKANNPTITRYHRTKTEYAPSIDETGLKAINPNYGENTGDADDFKDGLVWLSALPNRIPVLRNLKYTDPSAITTYKVSIPKDEYYSTPRYEFPYGRSGQPRLADIGKPSISHEGKEYLIDTYGKDIPSEYLQKVDETKLKAISKRDNINELVNGYNELLKYPVKYTRNDAFDLMKKYPDLPDKDLLSRDNELLGKLIETGYNSGVYGASVPKHGLRQLLDMIEYEPGINKLNQDKLMNIDILDDDGKYRDITSLMNEGSITRGKMCANPLSVISKSQDWDTYRELVDEGKSPWFAAMNSFAKPTISYDKYGNRKISFPSNVQDGKFAKGSITRGADYSQPLSELNDLGAHWNGFKRDLNYPGLAMNDAAWLNFYKPKIQYDDLGNRHIDFTKFTSPSSFSIGHINRGNDLRDYRKRNKSSSLNEFDLKENFDILMGRRK